MTLGRIRNINITSSRTIFVRIMGRWQLIKVGFQPFLAWFTWTTNMPLRSEGPKEFVQIQPLCCQRQGDIQIQYILIYVFTANYMYISDISSLYPISRYSKYFKIDGTTSVHFGSFDCSATMACQQYSSSSGINSGCCWNKKGSLQSIY